MRGIPHIVGALLLALQSTGASAASESLFSSGKFALTTVDGSSRLSDSFSPTSGVAAIAPGEQVRVDSDEIIRVSFTLPLSSTQENQSAGEEGVDDTEARQAAKKAGGLPEQIVLQVVPHQRNGKAKIVSFVPQVNKGNGKVAWSQRVDRLPATLASDDGVYALRLLVASAAGSAASPLSLELGQLSIPHLASPSAVSTLSLTPKEKEAQELGFYPWEERRHTFRKEVTEGMPGATKSLVVLAVLVAVPWVVLAGLLASVLPSVTFHSKPRASVSLLIAALLFLETIGVRYYRGDFTLFKMLPYFMGGSAVATIAVVAGALEGVGLKSGAVSTRAAK
ncbi:unnamed protein product [Parajaminaea phylloscopi]